MNTEHANNLRKALRAAFPDVKFSLRHYGIHYGYDLSWTEGPTEAQVGPVIVANKGDNDVHTTRKISQGFDVWAQSMVDGYNPYDYDKYAERARILRTTDARTIR